MMVWDKSTAAPRRIDWWRMNFIIDKECSTNYDMAMKKKLIATFFFAQILVGLFGSVETVNAQTCGTNDGACWTYGVSTYYSCACDGYGCYYTGPPYYVCWSFDCSRASSFSYFCETLGGDSKYTVCAPGSSQPSQDCPCGNLLCGI